ncbi:MAG: phospholipase [Hymenobacteraceae bacterium]|nr:phospholipase [Hymenobacteraceae bacterium]MDX5395902.1 phospholipase [Hymenobacteraceae bacterium]MDX5444361.1 phospholipase [Hymenobacteraceae bacterium]MDX5511957.1 phospholipase [Hymenobacteraceae bacterium]
MITGSIQVPRTARFAQIGEATAATNEVWVVCHGYGQLAKYFLRNFTSVAAPNRVVVAPEALSKFYLNGFSGRVGASWMTKEDRLDEIADYCRYLELLLEQILEKCAENATVNVLGFSQGAATVCRWLAGSRYRCHKLVLWTGAFPPDVDYSVVAGVLSRAKLVYVHGNQDALIDEARLQENLQLLQEIGLQPKLLRFEGKHELNKEVLEQVFSSFSHD